MKKSELRQLIKEEVHKVLLNECFSYYSWVDVLKKYPQMFDILKNDSIVKKEGYLTIGEDTIELEEIDNLDSLVNTLAQGGGACDYNFEDFTPKRLEKFFNYLTSSKNITKNTANKLIAITNDYFVKNKKEASDILKNSELERLKGDYLQYLQKLKKKKDGEKSALSLLKKDIEDQMDDKKSVVYKYKITTQDVLNYNINKNS